MWRFGFCGFLAFSLFSIAMPVKVPDRLGKISTHVLAPERVPSDWGIRDEFRPLWPELAAGQFSPARWISPEIKALFDEIKIRSSSVGANPCYVELLEQLAVSGNGALLQAAKIAAERVISKGYGVSDFSKDGFTQGTYSLGRLPVSHRNATVLNLVSSKEATYALVQLLTLATTMDGETRYIDERDSHSSVRLTVVSDAPRGKVEIPIASYAIATVIVVHLDGEEAHGEEQWHPLAVGMVAEPFFNQIGGAFQSIVTWANALKRDEKHIHEKYEGRAPLGWGQDLNEFGKHFCEHPSCSGWAEHLQQFRTCIAENQTFILRELDRPNEMRRLSIESPRPHVAILPLYLDGKLMRELHLTIPDTGFPIPEIPPYKIAPWN